MHARRLRLSFYVVVIFLLLDSNMAVSSSIFISLNNHGNLIKFTLSCIGIFEYSVRQHRQENILARYALKHILRGLHTPVSGKLRIFPIEKKCRCPKNNPCYQETTLLITRMRVIILQSIIGSQPCITKTKETETPSIQMFQCTTRAYQLSKNILTCQSYILAYEMWL